MPTDESIQDTIDALHALCDGARRASSMTEQALGPLQGASVALNSAPDSADAQGAIGAAQNEAEKALHAYADYINRAMALCQELAA